VSLVGLAELAPLCVFEVSLWVVVTGAAMHIFRIVRIHDEFTVILDTVWFGASVLRVGLDPPTEFLNLF